MQGVLMMHNLIHRRGGFNMGDLGEELEEVEFEPMPETAPVKEPAAPTPARDPVPA